MALTLLTSSGPAGSVQARDVPMDGALIYSCDETSSALSWLKRRRLPLVLVDQAPSTEYSSVNIDDRRGAQLAAQHVVDLGHRNIAVVTSNVAGPEGLIDDPTTLEGGHTIRQRMAGWLEVLSAAGIRPTVVQVSHFGANAGDDAAELLFGLPDRPTAVLCFSDATAYGVRARRVETRRVGSRSALRRRFRRRPARQPHDTATHDHPPGWRGQGSSRGGSAHRRDRPQPNRERPTSRATNPARRTRRSREHRGPLNRTQTASAPPGTARGRPGSTVAA